MTTAETTLGKQIQFETPVYDAGIAHAFADDRSRSQVPCRVASSTMALSVHLCRVVGTGAHAEKPHGDTIPRRMRPRYTVDLPMVLQKSESKLFAFVFGRLWMTMYASLCIGALSVLPGTRRPY